MSTCLCLVPVLRVEAHAKPTRADGEELAGWELHHYSITLVLLDLLPLLVSCFCRFICRILICSKTGDLATSVCLQFPSQLSPQLRPNNPCLSSGVGPQLGTVETCQPVPLPRTANPPPKEKNYAHQRTPGPAHVLINITATLCLSLTHVCTRAPV